MKRTTDVLFGGSTTAAAEVEMVAAAAATTLSPSAGRSSGRCTMTSVCVRQPDHTPPSTLGARRSPKAAARSTTQVQSSTVVLARATQRLTRAARRAFAPAFPPAPISCGGAYARNPPARPSG